MRKILILLTIYLLFSYLKVCIFEGPALALGNTPGLSADRKTEQSLEPNRDEKNLEAKRNKKKKDKKIFVPDEYIRLELDKTIYDDKEPFDAE